jgi:hypothetical protein
VKAVTPVSYLAETEDERVFFDLLSFVQVEEFIITFQS